RRPPTAPLPYTTLFRSLKRSARAEDGRLDLEQVLRGLDDQQIDPAGEQSRGLLGEHLDEFAEADLPQRGVLGGGQVAGRADRAQDRKSTRLNSSHVSIS